MLILLKLALLQHFINFQDGTEIGRGTSLPLSSLTALESGSSISFSGKEIEIMEEVQPEAIQAFKQAATVEKSKSFFSVLNFNQQMSSKRLFNKQYVISYVHTPKRNFSCHTVSIVLGIKVQTTTTCHWKYFSFSQICSS